MPIVDSVSRKDGEGSVWPWIFAVTTTTALMVVRRKIQLRREADAKIDSEAREQGEEKDDNSFELSISYDMMEPLDKKKVTAVDRLPEMFASTPPHQKKDDHSKDGTEQTESSFCSISSFQSERVEV